MPSVFEQELGSYEIALREVEARIGVLSESWPQKNFTQEALEYVNRQKLLIVGLCSLVEARLYLEAYQYPGPERLEDYSGQGIWRLKSFLSDVGLINFGHLTRWPRFRLVYKIRNVIIHSYGGLVFDAEVQEIDAAADKLGFESLLDTRRLRIRPEHLYGTLDIVRQLINEIEDQLSSS